MMRTLLLVLMLLPAADIAAGGSGELSPDQSRTPDQLEASDSLDARIKEHLDSIGIRTFENRIQAVEFEVAHLDGGTRSLDDFAGEFVFLNFWASWCGPCREEMPSMEQLQAEMGDLPVRIVAVNVQESEETARSYIDEFGYTFDVILDRSGQIAQRYGVRGLPTTYFVSPTGSVVGGLLGTRSWDDPEIVEAMRRIGEVVGR